jgi:serine protease Do
VENVAYLFVSHFHSFCHMSLVRQLPKFLICAITLGVAVYFCHAQRGASSTAGRSGFREVLSIDNTPIKREAAPLKSYADVIDRIEPAVVKISTAQEVLLRQRRSPYADDPFLRRFFGITEEPSRVERHKQPLGLGSGVIVTRDGYILTNNHVIQGATEIKVSVPGREEQLDAKVIDSDPDNDVAVIKVEGEGLPIAIIADSSQVRRGDIVFAVGAPFGYEQSVSMGIVSALGRRDLGNNQQANYIQTDAAINPGNSGGPLIDADGRVVGINTAIYSNTGSSAGIGFAIPSNRVIQIAANLVSPKAPGQSGYLGAQTAPMTAQMAKFLKLAEPGGVHVTAVNAKSPAERGGVQVDDVILELQGRKIQEPSQLNDEVAALPAGREVALTVWRAGERKELKVTLGDRTQARPGAPDDVPDEAPKGSYGLKLTELTNDLRAQLGLDRRTVGVIVEKVAENSAAAREGLEPGDLIYRINRFSIRNPEEAKAAFAKSTDGASLLHVYRGGRNAQVILQE